MFELERDLLLQKGNDVHVYTKCSDDLVSRNPFALIFAAIGVVWSFKSYKEVSSILGADKYDLIHVHNTFPMISLSVLWANKKKVPLVMTLHNYRMFCLGALITKDNDNCLICIKKKNAIYGLINGCYRKSILASFPLMLSIAVHRWLQTLKKCVSSFVVLNSYQKDIMILGGLESDKIHVKPNFFPNSTWKPVDYTHRDRTCIYIGRLGSEKGVEFLIEAWKILGERAPLLHIVGSGELFDSINIKSKGLNICLHGQLKHPDVLNTLSKSTCLILPSVVTEGFPMVIREAFALGTPVGVSKIEPLTSIVEEQVTGFFFNARDAQSIADAVENFFSDSSKIKKMIENSYSEYKNKYTEDINYETLKKIYSNAIVRHV